MNFDRLARPYRWLETIAFQNALQAARTCWVNDIPRPGRTLIVGEGNGRFLGELLRVHPGINVDCIDASHRMLALARARVARLRPESLGPVQFLQRDIFDWSPAASYDLLVTHFFLDCFVAEQVAAVVTKLARAARPNAIWLIADFTIPSGKFARAYAKFWLRLMYSFFRATAKIPASELVDPAPYLLGNGFVAKSQKVFRHGMLKSNMYVASSG